MSGWQIHIDELLQATLGLQGRNAQLVSVKDIISRSGLYSGLVSEIREHISSPNWKDAVLVIQRGYAPGWFIVKNTLFW